MINTKLTPLQRQAIIKINDAIEEGLRRGLIILRGPFQSGKTQVLHEVLRQRALPAKSHYLNLNQFLLSRLSRQMKEEPELSFHLLSLLKAKTSRLFEDYLQQFLNDFFQERNFLIIDAVELLFNYSVNLPQITYNYCRDANTIIISIPHDIKTGFEFHWTSHLAKIIEIK